MATYDQIAIDWLEANEGDGGEMDACRAVIEMLKGQLATRDRERVVRQAAKHCGPSGVRNSRRHAAQGCHDHGQGARVMPALVENKTQALSRQLAELEAYRLAELFRPVTYEAFGRLFRTQQRVPLLHFVRFRDDRYLNAVKVFGKPDFIHRHWDHRAVAEVMPGDMVVFAEGDEHSDVTAFSYDDSAFF